MRVLLQNRWESIRSSYWFSPGIYVASSFILAIAMIKLDAAYPLEQWRWKAWRTAGWIEITDAAARVTLGTMVGALVTVTGVVFSLTMLLLSQTTSQYGPRLVRTFMQRRTSQSTLGLFLGTSVYGLIVLRSIREPQIESDAFVPHLAVLVGEIAAGACLIVLIGFLHSVSQSIRAETVVRSVYEDLCGAIERIYPRYQVGGEEPHTAAYEVSPVFVERECFDSHISEDPSFPFVVPSHRDGYLQAIDLNGLVELSVSYQLQLRLSVTPGDYIVEGDSLCVATMPQNASSTEVISEITRRFFYGSRRTPSQDIECAVLELVEVAVRSLSPGINDPFTAMLCIDYLGAAFCRMLGRGAPQTQCLDHQGVPRVLVRPRAFDELLSTACDQIRWYGSSDAKVLTRLALMLHRMKKRARDATIVETIDGQIERLRQAIGIETGDKDARQALRKACDAEVGEASSG